jgi:hypothetical protein
MDVTLFQLAEILSSLVHRPVVFFKDRAVRPPSWGLAVGGPALCTCLILTSQLLFLSTTAPPLTAALARAGVPAPFVVSSQYLGLVAAASVCAMTWLVASAVLMAWDVLFTGAENVARVPEMAGLAFYSQVPWLLVVIIVAVYYQPPFPEAGTATALEPERLLRLLAGDETRLVLRTVNEASTLWLHGLFGAGYHAVSGNSLPRCLLLALGIYGLPHLMAALV